MAIQYYPSLSVADQIRRTALRVNTGGESGRTLVPAHKGIGLNQNSGGLNTRGTGAKLLPKPTANPNRPVPVPSMRPVTGPVRLPKPMGPSTVNRGFASAPAPVPAGDMVRVPKMTPSGYRLVSVAASSLPPAALAAARKNAYNGQPALSPKPGVPDAGFGGPDAHPTGLDYTGLQSYTNGMRDINDTYGAQEDDLRQQLADNPRLYANAVADDRLAAQRGASATADQMSNAGLLRSGAREMADADRVKMYSDHMNQIESQYGATASSKIQAALDHLAGQEARDRQGVEDSAKSEWGQVYPSNPIYDEPAPAAPAASAGKYAAPVGRKLVAYAPGKYHLVTTGARKSR